MFVQLIWIRAGISHFSVSPQKYSATSSSIKPQPGRIISTQNKVPEGLEKFRFLASPRRVYPAG
jgi:hypothetical protein